MIRLTIAALGALALTGCAGARIAKPAVCDGKNRRPANLYGSVLPSLPVPLPASQSGGQSMVVPGPVPGPSALPAPPATPTPGVESAPASPATGPATTPSPAPRTSQRTVAPSYRSC